MMGAKGILRSVNICLVFLWPPLAFAAASTFGSTFEGVGLTAWLMVVVLSTVAGLTALLNRLGNELRNASEGGPKLPPIPLFVAANLLASWVTGLFFFLICEHFDVSDFLEAAIVIGASYTGARLIERMMEGVVDRFLERIGDFMGAKRNSYPPRYDDRGSVSNSDERGSHRP